MNLHVILIIKEMVNMKLLRLSAKNYKNCEDDLSIDFVPIARKTEEDKTYELNLIDEDLYTFTTTAIVGKNASGKTSILKLIQNIYTILGEFRLEDELVSIDGTKLEMFFYHDKQLFNYQVELRKQSNVGNSLSFVNERLFSSNYYKTKKNKIFDLRHYKELKINRALPDDISILYYILKERKNYAYYYDDLEVEHKGIYHEVYDLYNQVLDKKYWKHILLLFDENIKDLTEIKKDIFRLDYFNSSMELSAKDLSYILSSGTTKGIALYTAGIRALLEGSAFIIDEIENHFHKTLVENLISLFKDKAVNKNGAILMFSTHYCELLDLFARNDNIWISKADKKIKLTNMYRDYSIRNDLLKSKKFYTDNFGTSVSYESLMNLKRDLMNE